MIRPKGFRHALTLAGIIGLAAAMAMGGPVPVGSLVGSRNTTLDGHIPLPHTTMLSGDRLQVKDGLAMVTLIQGNRVILGRMTEASFSRRTGAVTVSLTHGNISLYHPQAGANFRIEAGDVIVAPEKGRRTLGEIAMVDGLLLISVKDGMLQVQEAGTTQDVGKGKTITLATTAAPGPAPNSPQNRHASHTLRHDAPDIEALSATGIGAAIAGIALARSSKQVSPVTPTP